VHHEKEAREYAILAARLAIVIALDPNNVSSACHNFNILIPSSILISLSLVEFRLFEHSLEVFLGRANILSSPLMSNLLPAPQVHPSSIVENGAKLAAGVIIGPFCHVGPEVALGEGTQLISNVTIMNATTLGMNCLLCPGSILGGTP
jgi:UDP-3-O-[3-hydroxymyristoyl] glucosamine N-acyltransferase